GVFWFFPPGAGAGPTGAPSPGPAGGGSLPPKTPPLLLSTFDFLPGRPPRPRAPRRQPPGRPPPRQTKDQCTLPPPPTHSQPPGPVAGAGGGSRLTRRSRASSSTRVEGRSVRCQRVTRLRFLPARSIGPTT